MSAQPTDQSWAVAIVADEVTTQPLGSGVLIDDLHVITARHVVDKADGRKVWVAFPKAEPDLGERRYERVRLDAQAVDAVVVELAAPAPAGVRPARIRMPAPTALANAAADWWAFGFATGDLVGNRSSGRVDAALGGGMVLLETTSKYLVEGGYSGAGVWSPPGEYDAVVGIVVQARDGDARALTLHQIEALLPEAKLSALADAFSAVDAGPVALAQWGWSAVRDVELRAHWRPRARGVMVDAEQGFRFQGRRQALLAIVEWLGRPTPDRRVLVVTGSPGVGKSAVLGRIVTTADPVLVAELPAADDGVRATVGALACAVHAKGKTALDIATEVARAASAELPARVDDAVNVIRAALEERRPSRFNVVIDAVDEAVSAHEARLTISRLARPLVETCADVGVQLVIGTRRHIGAMTVDELLGPAQHTIDLDTPQYFDLADLTAYCLANLHLLGDERSDNPYLTHPAAAVALAAAIAERAHRNFLVAGLISRTHGLHDYEPSRPDDIRADPTVANVLESYIEDLPAIGSVDAQGALTALAFAEAPGFTPRLWSIATDALYGTAPTPDELATFARSGAANFIIEQTDAGDQRLRLFHQALNDTLIATRGRRQPHSSDQARLVRRFLAEGRREDWESADEYLLQNLPTHADRAGPPAIDDLLADDNYLLHADLRRLSRVARHGTGRYRRRARLTGVAGSLNRLRGAQRAAQLSILDAVRGTHTDIPWATVAPDTPYHVTASQVRDQWDLAVYTGHTGAARAVCALTLDGRPVIASASNDGTVRIWDPRDPDTTIAVHTGHAGAVNAVCAVQLFGRPMIASASNDETVRIWDPRDPNTTIAVHTGHTNSVNAVCAVQLDGRPMIVSASHDRTVRVWDPRDPYTTIAVHTGHTSWVSAVCALDLDGLPVIVSAGDDETVRVWDLRGPDITIAVHTGHTNTLSAVCAMDLDGRPVIASAGLDRTVRVWDPRDPNTTIAVHTGHTSWVKAVCAMDLDGRPVIASAGDDETVRVWDLRDPDTTIAVHTGHTDWVDAVCALDLDGRQVIASAGLDRTVRVWDPRDPATTIAVHTGHTDWVKAVCALDLDGRPVIVSAGTDGPVRVWDPRDPDTTITAHTGHVGSVNAVCALDLDGRPVIVSAGAHGPVRVWDPRDPDTTIAVHTGHVGSVNAVCALDLDGRPVIVSAGIDGRVWDPRDPGTTIAVHTGHVGSVNAVCALDLDGRPVIASASHDRTVQVWDPRDPDTTIAVHTGHVGPVNAVCALDLDGRPVIASASHDKTVRVWDPHNPCTTIPVHNAALALAAVRGQLIIALEIGVVLLAFHK